MKQAILLMALSGALFGQVAGTSGELSGVVTDPAGSAIPGAAILVTNQETGLERKVITGGSGEYRVTTLLSGVYQVRAEKENFQAALAKDIRVTIGQVSRADLRLALGTANQTLDVSADAQVIEVERTQQQNTLEREFVQNLPIDRRDYLTFSLLAPGVVDANAMADNSDYRVAQTGTSGLSFYGSNGRGNSITVDGGEANDAAGGARPTLSQEAVEEFQINRSNYSAELGSATGGVINIVSRAGTNALHGSLFGFFRNQSMDASDPFARVLQNNNQLVRVKPNANRQQFGGSLGGPIARDKTFFFGAFEVLNRDENNTVAVLTDPGIFNPTPDQERILAALPAAAAAQLRPALTAPESTRALFAQNSGIFPFKTNDYKFSTRLDHNASDKNQFFFRYSYASSDESNAATRALVGASRGSEQSIFDSNILAGWTHVANSNLLNEARVQWNYDSRIFKSTEKFGPEINIAGFGFFNRDIFLPFASISRRWDLKDNVSYFRGNHRVKFGGQAMVRGNHEDSATFFGGRFNFGSLPGSLVNAALASTTITALQAFNLGLPQAYQQGFGDPVVAATYPYYGFYIQDSWKARPNLTLDLGLRYELDTRLAPVRTDKNNFAPRFGFAWDPFSDGKTSVRGGYGIFYSPIYFQIDYTVNALGVINGRQQIAQVLTTIQTPGIASSANIYRTLRAQGVLGVPSPTRSIVPGDLAQFGIAVSQTGPRPPFSVTFEPSKDYANPYAQQAEFGIERQVARDFALSATYTFVRTLKVTRSRDGNLLPAPVDPALGIRVWRTQDFVNPLLFQQNIYESTGRAFYSGVILEAKKRFGSRFSMSANYTFSRATDEVTDYNSDFQPNDQTNLRAERSLSSFDQRHKFVAYGMWQAPGGLQLTPIVRANSGRPFNLLTGIDINNDRHSTTDRPPGAGRNTGRGPRFVTFDLRLAKQIRLGGERRMLQFTAEAFNLTNTLNYASVNNTVGLLAPPFRVTGRDDRTPSEPLGFTSSFDARRVQLGVRFSF